MVLPLANVDGLLGQKGAFCTKDNSSLHVRAGAGGFRCSGWVGAFLGLIQDVSGLTILLLLCFIVVFFVFVVVVVFGGRGVSCFVLPKLFFVLFVRTSFLFEALSVHTVNIAVYPLFFSFFFARY